jgi:ubiquinone/menaquinone biosynthesis C-methylase UbiE
MQSKAEWETRNEVLSRSLSELVNRHKPRRAKRAIDVGAQDGSLMDRYALLTGLSYVGIDPAFSEESCSPAGAALLPGTAEQLSFPDETFDVVMLANVYEHIQPENRLTALREMHRVLSSGGVVIGQIPNPYFPIENHSRLPFMGYLPMGWQKRYWSLSRVPWEHDFFVVTPRNLRNDAEAAGFSVRIVRRFNYPLEALPRQVRPVARALDWPMRRFMPWAWQFVLER